jgi:hypothetical protein
VPTFAVSAVTVVTVIVRDDTEPVVAVVDENE